MKIDLWRIGYAVGLIFIVWVVLGSLVAWLLGVPSLYKPKEGDQCGPHHHWVYVGFGDNPDLSCEADR